MSSGLLKSPLPYLALFVAHLIWGANFVIAKLTLWEFPVMSLAFLRFFLAFILLVPFLLVFSKKDLKVKIEHWPKLFGAAILMVTLNIAFFFEGISRTSAISASSLTMSIPIFSVLIAWIFLREKIYFVNFLGVLFGLLGAMVILGLPLIFLGSYSSTELTGNLFILLSSLSSVVGIIFAKQLLKTYHPIILSTIFFGIASLSFLFPAILEYVQNPAWINKVSVLGVLGLFYMALMSSVVAYFLLSWAIEKVDIVQASMFEYINPAVTATLAVPILGERISFSFIIGTCLVILGVYWGTLGKSEHHHIHHKHHRI